MEKIKWCKKKRRGIKIIEPNENLASEYIRNAEESLRVLNSLKDTGSNMWFGYYKILR